MIIFSKPGTGQCIMAKYFETLPIKKIIRQIYLRYFYNAYTFICVQQIDLGVVQYIMWLVKILHQYIIWVKLLSDTNHMVNIKMRNLKCKIDIFETLSDLSIILKLPGCHMVFSRLVALSISSLHNLDIEANKFYDRAH